MFFIPLKRDELLSIVQGERLKHLFPIAVGQLRQIAESQSGPIAVWRDNPLPHWPLPNLLLLPVASRGEFFAWTTSFVKIKPLTSVIRVLDFETFRMVEGKVDRTARIVRGIAGLVIGEALTYLEHGSPKLTLRTCESTFSFAVGKSILSVLGPRGLAHAGFNWFRARQALANKFARLRSDELRQPWTAVLSLLGAKTDEFDLSPMILECVKDIYKSGFIAFEHWGKLTRGTPELRTLETLMRDTREERVITLERALRSLTSSSLEREEASFIAGYLISRVAPGTLDHWKLLDPVRGLLPIAGLWYSLCAAINEETTIVGYGGGLGRLIIRELEREADLLDRPICDIAVDELEVLGGSFKVDQFATASNTNVEVEISPAVTVPFRSATKESASSEPLYLDFGNTPNINQIDPSILGVVEGVIKSMQEIKREVQRLTPESSQMDPKRQRKKRSKH